jgi:AbrB family looped-hinge helix DNA binding protein
MTTTTLSSKGQVVLPKKVRDALHLQPGARLAVHTEGARIVLETRRERWTPVNPTGRVLSDRELCAPVDLGGGDSADRD